MLEVLIFFIFAVIIGLMCTFFGYAFFRILLPFWGFFAGLVFGYQGIESFMNDGFLSAAIALTIGIILGLVLAATAFWFYELAVYLFGISAGYILGYGLASVLHLGDTFIPTLFGVAGAILMAILFAKTSFPKLWIMIVTAAAGSMIVITGIFVLFGATPAVADSLDVTRYMVNTSFFWTLVWAILAGFGFVFQYALTKQAEDLSKSYDWEALEKDMAAAKKDMAKS